LIGISRLSFLHDVAVAIYDRDCGSPSRTCGIPEGLAIVRVFDLVYESTVSVCILGAFVVHLALFRDCVIEAGALPGASKFSCVLLPDREPDAVGVRNEELGKREIVRLREEVARASIGL
jgi:hypothetical protein